MDRSTLYLGLGFWLSLLAPPVARAVPQQSGPTGFLMELENIFPDSYGRAISLDLDQSDLFDVALVETTNGSDSLVVRFEPGEWITHTEVTDDVVSFDGLKPYGSQARAGLIIATTSGLEVAYWDDENVAPENRTWDCSPITCDSSSDPCCDWSDIEIVRVADIDGTNGPDIVGIEGNTVRILLEQGGSWDCDSSYPDFSVASGTIVDAILYDATGSGARDHIALMYTDKLAVYEADGTQVALSSTLVDHESVGVARITHPSEEWVTWLVRSTDGDPIDQDQFLGIVGTAFRPPISLVDSQNDPWCFRGMCGGDFDNDGYDDVALHAPLYGEDLILLNGSTGSAPDFGVSSGSVLVDVPKDDGDPTGEHVYTAQPVFVDLDRDGDLDLVQPVEEGDSVPSTFAAWRNTRVDENDFRVTLGDVDIAVCEEDTDSTITLNVTLPDPLPTRATHLLFRLWIKDSGTEPVDPTVYAYEYTELTTATDYEFSVLLEDMVPTYPVVFYYAARLVEVDDSDPQDPVVTLKYPVKNSLVVDTLTSWAYDFWWFYLIDPYNPDSTVTEFCPSTLKGGGSGAPFQRRRSNGTWLGGFSGGGSTECLPGEDPPEPDPDPPPRGN